MKIKLIQSLTFLFILPIFYFSQTDDYNKITTVDSVDLNKYVGTWYEIAKIPNSFQDQCVKNTTATYKINNEGDIEVVNKCIDEKGEFDSADGIARVVDKKSNSKLEVSFVSIFGWNIFCGDYWILGLDKNYKYAAIGTPSKKYGWIMSRTPKLSKEEMEICFSIFEKNGYSRKLFELDKQE